MIAVEMPGHPGGHEVCVVDDSPPPSRPVAAEAPASTNRHGAPTVGPLKRPKPPAASTYKPGDPVWLWIWRYERWLPGEVGGTSPLAVLVRYERPGGAAEVDTVTAAYVMARGKDGVP